jgi:hypothetical protein
VTFFANSMNSFCEERHRRRRALHGIEVPGHATFAGVSGEVR